MGILKELKLVKGNSKAAAIFESLHPDFRTFEYKLPTDYVRYFWNEYQTKTENKNNSQNGKIFELIIATLLLREKIIPFYINAQITFVNDVNFDIILYSNIKKCPIVLSVKTTLRERYKQAEWESLKLKDVHKGAKSYLITIDDEYQHYLKKREDGEIRLNDILYAFSNEFNAFIYHLKSTSICEAPNVPVIKSNMIVK